MLIDLLPGLGGQHAKTSLGHDAICTISDPDARPDIVVIFCFPSLPSLGSMEANSKPASQSIGVGLSPGGIAEVSVAASLFSPTSPWACPVLDTVAGSGAGLDNIVKHGPRLNGSRLSIGKSNLIVTERQELSDRAKATMPQMPSPFTGLDFRCVQIQSITRN